MEYKFANTDELVKFLSDELISAAEAIEILEISKVRIGKLVKDGKLTAVKDQPKMFLKIMVLKKRRTRTTSLKISPI